MIGECESAMHFIDIFKLAPKAEPRKAKEHTAREIRPPQDPGRDAPAARKIQADGAAVAADRDHAPENLVFMDRRVVAGQGIPARDELLATVAAAVNDTVRHELCVFTGHSFIQHNLPAPELRKTLPANREQIARPHRGQHAVPGGFESNLSEIASNFHQQLALSRRPEVFRGGHENPFTVKMPCGWRGTPPGSYRSCRRSAREFRRRARGGRPAFGKVS